MVALGDWIGDYVNSSAQQEENYEPHPRGPAKGRTGTQCRRGCKCDDTICGGGTGCATRRKQRVRQCSRRLPPNWHCCPSSIERLLALRLRCCALRASQVAPLPGRKHVLEFSGRRSA